MPGDILPCHDVADYNDFAHPDRVATKPFKGAKVTRDALVVTLPAHSIVTLTIK